jgi:hypothetical protein
LLNEPAGKATTTYDVSDPDPRDSDVAISIVSFGYHVMSKAVVSRGVGALPRDA